MQISFLLDNKELCGGGGFYRARLMLSILAAKILVFTSVWALWLTYISFSSVLASPSTAFSVGTPSDLACVSTDCELFN